MTNSVVIIAAAIIIVVGIGYVAYDGGLGGTTQNITYTQNPDDYTDQKAQRVAEEGIGKGSLEYYGNTINIALTSVDAEDNGQERTDDTNVDVDYYTKNSNGDYRFVKHSSSQISEFSLDGKTGTLYAKVTVPSGQDFYVDVEGTTESNERIGQAEWKIVEIGDSPTWIFPVNVKYISASPDPRNTPRFDWFTSLWTDDSSNVALNNPPNTDTDNLGTSKVDCAIDWRLEHSQDASASFLRRVNIAINSTDDSLWSERNSGITINHNYGQTLITLDRMDDDRDKTAGETTYRYTVGEGDINDALIYVVQNGESNLKTDVPVVIETNFDSATNGLNVTLGLTFIDAQGNTNSISDLALCAK